MRNTVLYRSCSKTEDLWNTSSVCTFHWCQGFQHHQYNGKCPLTNLVHTELVELLCHGLTYLIQAIFVKNCALNSLALKNRAVFLSKAEGEGNKCSAVSYFSIRLSVSSQYEAVESKK